MAKVLIVDDDDEIREMLCDALKRCLFDVRCACGVDEAVAAMRQERFDVVVSDLVMPRPSDACTLDGFRKQLAAPAHDGLEAIADIKALCPDVRIVAISGSIPDRADEFLAKAKELGASYVFKKPFGMRALTKAVCDLAGESTDTLQVRRKDLDDC